LVSPVVIDDNVWIGEGVVILPGITIGKGAIVGANSVVTKNVSAYTIVVGAPAKVIKKYNFNTKHWERIIE
jgi:lipopolysaccharide O-acetyltransferase